MKFDKMIIKILLTTINKVKDFFGFFSRYKYQVDYFYRKYVSKIMFLFNDNILCTKDK